MATEFAVIDIGSNSVRYAEEQCGALHGKEIYTTRLGFGLADTGRLNDERMRASLDVILSLAQRARQNGLVPMAYATSAVRDAENGREFADRVLNTCGVPVDILSGEREARYAFMGASGAEGRYDTLLDIGGASTQIVTLDSAASFRAGCVRCADMFNGVRRTDRKKTEFACEDPDPAPCDIDPLAKSAALYEYLDKEITADFKAPGRIVGVGGTITTLAALNKRLLQYSDEAVEGSRLDLAEISMLSLSLMAMGDSKRRAHPLLRERHDVIFYGVCILRYLIKNFAETNIPEDEPERLGKLSNYGLNVSTKDGMEGYLLHLKEL